MSEDKQKDGLQSERRRNFLAVTAKYGFTAAVAAAAAGTLGSSRAVAQTAQAEKEREKAAKHTMILATESRLGASLWSQLMQLHDRRRGRDGKGVTGRVESEGRG